jgi:hypothetical protein
MDGILSLVDSRKLCQIKCQLNSETPVHLGYSVARSSYNDKKLFLARLASDGSVDYCMISNSKKDFPDCDPNEIYNNTGNIINFSDFSSNQIYLYF